MIDCLTWTDVSLWAALGAAMAGCAAGHTPPPSDPPRFIPRQASRAYTQSLAAPPDEILPLLTPIGEKAWAHGWDPVVLFEAPPPGNGTLFATRHPGQPDTIWLLESFDPATRRVRYVHITPGSDVTEIDIELRPAASGRTDAEIRYTYTGLSERGNVLVDSWTPERYRHFMITWEEELNEYLSRHRRAEGVVERRP